MPSDFGVSIIDDKHVALRYGRYEVIVESKDVDIANNPALIKEAERLATRLIAKRCFVRMIIYSNGRWDLVFQYCPAKYLALALPEAKVKVASP